jgi:hypothetical protein
MRTWVCAMVMAAVPLAAAAVQETFTEARPLDCVAVKTCSQDTGDGLFTLRFRPAYPWSAPSPLGFDVREKAVEIRNANGGLMDLTVMSVSLTGSTAYNGMSFIGAIRLDVQDAAGQWSPASQWSSWVGSPAGIYVIFDGRHPQSPLVRDVRAVRLSGVNGTTAFRIGMMNLTPH